MSTRYLHGYSPTEHRRLHRQAKTFEPLLHRDLRFPRGTHLLEVGCGAGAQTALLLKNNPRLRITSVDRSDVQLAAAQYLTRRAKVARGQLTFLNADATALPFTSGTFDAALSVWLLEHAPDPLPILREIRRVLKPSGRLHLREVFNATVHIRPRLAPLESYWAAYNTLQEELAGNPNVGVCLGNLLRAAGFSKMNIHPEPIWFDRRTPALRKQWLQYWEELLLSAADNLLQHQRTTRPQITAMQRAFKQLRANPDTIFFFSPIFGYAQK